MSIAAVLFTSVAFPTTTTLCKPLLLWFVRPYIEIIFEMVMQSNNILYLLISLYLLLPHVFLARLLEQLIFSFVCLSWLREGFSTDFKLTLIITQCARREHGIFNEYCMNIVIWRIVSYFILYCILLENFLIVNILWYSILSDTKKNYNSLPCYYKILVSRDRVVISKIAGVRFDNK